MPRVARLKALEILDSRGRPTVLAEVTLEGGAAAQASVPSGASTGRAEARELRDSDAKRYRGLGCRRAVANIHGPIADAIVGVDLADQSDLDAQLLAADGTEDKSKLGANAILAVSIAFARACAAQRDLPLYEHFAGMLGNASSMTLPRLTVNLFSGGKHAGGQVPLQDVLVVPASAKTIDESLAMVWAVYQAAADLTLKKYGSRALTADEGGLAPPFTSIAAMFDDTVQAIRDAGFEPGKDVAIAVDVASSHFYSGEGEAGRYDLGRGQSLDSRAMIEQIGRWARDYPIVSLEDGLSENDWDNWPALRQELTGRSITLGDDFLCTNPGRIERAIQMDACDALLLKVNQIGSLTEAAAALRLARQAGWRVTVSARSGETEDNWLADLAVGWSGDQIKVGSVTQSERLAKYNRLLAIEDERTLPIVDWPHARK